MPESSLAIIIDTTSPVPPFEQLRVQIARMTAHSELEPGTKLPTIRQLSIELGLAPNTVARAYRELESDGVIVTEGRRGTFVHSATFPRDVSKAVTPLATDFVRAARRAGLTMPQTVRLVEQAWRAP